MTPDGPHAMPRSILETGMERIADSIERHNKGLC